MLLVRWDVALLVCSLLALCHFIVRSLLREDNRDGISFRALFATFPVLKVVARTRAIGLTAAAAEQFAVSTALTPTTCNQGVVRGFLEFLFMP